ncbi:MAG: cardiolipin synthase, partial [Clostridia bacterium]|nr:cardiolipin synthase [Clostridia bacterium]
YTPGFIHAKNFVCDDKYGTVGSINLDYRSLYLHFECGVWLCETSSIAQIKEDFLQILRVSRECTLEETQNVKLPTRLLRSIMRTFSPLL